MRGATGFSGLVAFAHRGRAGAQGDFREAKKYRAVFRQVTSRACQHCLQHVLSTLAEWRVPTQLHLKVLNKIKAYFTSQLQAAAARVTTQKQPAPAGFENESALAFVAFRCERAPCTLVHAHR